MGFATPNIKKEDEEFAVTSTTSRKRQGIASMREHELD